MPVHAGWQWKADESPPPTASSMSTSSPLEAFDARGRTPPLNAVECAFFTVWHVFLPRSSRVCSAGFWGHPMRRSVPSWPTGGSGGALWANRTVGTISPAARPGPWPRPRPSQGAGPTPSQNGWGRPPACAAWLAGPRTGRESTHAPGFGPSRTAGLAPRGGERSAGRPG
jgi:hypothetical protein